MNKKKLPITHYESFVQSTKRLFGKDIISILRDLAKQQGKGLEDLDDRFFDKSIEKTFGFKESDMQSPMMKSEFKALRSLLYHLWNFSLKKKIYRLEEGLTAKLLHTHVKKVDNYFVKSPYKSIYLSIPFNQELVIRNALTGLHKVVGIYVYLEDIEGRSDIHTSTDLRVGVPISEQSNSPKTLLRILAIGESKPNESPLKESDDATYYSTFFLGDGDIFPQIEDHIKKWIMPSSTEEDILHMRKMLHFVVNALLYITSGPNDINLIKAKFTPTGGLKKQKLAAANIKNKGLSKIDQLSLGGSIRLSPGLKQAYNEGSLSEYSINCPKWLVSGHWRNQAHGEGMLKRKLIWIEPYEKGKGLSEDISVKDTVVS